MPRITDEFFLYNLELNDGCVLARADQEIPDDRLQDFSLEVSRIAKVTLKPGLYRYRGPEYEDKLQGIFKLWKEPHPHMGFDAWDVEANIRQDFNDENSVIFEGVRLRIVYQYASW
jgi:hypothetical protein